MRLRVAISFLLCLSCLRLPVSGQQSASPPVVRDSQSLAALQQSVAAMGGSAALPNTGIVAHGQITVPPAGISGPILWENQGSEFRYERPGVNGAIVFVSGHGDAALIDGVSVQRNISHLAISTPPPHLPALCLLSAINNPAMRVTSPQQVSLNSLTAIKISMVDQTDEITSVVTQQDWYLDPKTMLPLRLDFVTAEIHNAVAAVKMTYVFSNYQRVSGVMIPFNVAMLADSQKMADIAFTSVEVGASISPTDFDVPANTAVAK